MDIAITYMYEAGGAGFYTQREKNWPFFFYPFHNRKCKKLKCWKVKFTNNQEVTIKELKLQISKITKNSN